MFGGISCGLYYKNMMIVIDDRKWRHKLECLSNVINYAPRAINYTLESSIMLLESSVMLLKSSIMFLENNKNTGVTHDDCQMPYDNINILIVKANHIKKLQNK